MERWMMQKKTSIQHLTPEGKKIFRAIVGEYEIQGTPWHQLARVTAEAYDRAQKAREAIDRDGMTVIDKFGQRKPHPLLAIERDSRAAFLAGLKALNLDLEPLRDGPGRPPGK
jgi:hypothetical protein